MVNINNIDINIFRERQIAARSPKGQGPKSRAAVEDTSGRAAEKARTPIALSGGARPAEARNVEQRPESEVSGQQGRPRRRAEGRERKPRQQHRRRRRTRQTQEEGQRKSQARAAGGSGGGGRRGSRRRGGITSAEERGGEEEAGAKGDRRP